MSQNYVIVPRINPARRDEPAKFYAQSRSMKKTTVEEICKRISQRSSFSQGELEGCIGEFLLEIQNILEEGNIAQLGRLGNFRLTLKTGVPTAVAKDFNLSNIKGCKVNFHPSIQLQALCKSIRYKLYKPDPENETPEGEETPKA